MDKISIIIPCYNIERYIDRCLESVVNQTIGLDMLEIIVVNDASTDGTLDKLYQWEKRYPENIMVITYEVNLRQGGARNLALQYATGEYIGYVDSDDWIEPNMYELLYEKMRTGKYDFVKCKFIRESYEGEHILTRANRRDVEYCFTSRNGLYFGGVTDTGNCGSYGGFWSGLYKKSMLVEKEIYFPEHLAYDDNFFNGIWSLYIERLGIVDAALYHYYVNPNSVVTSRNAPHQMDRMSIEVMLVEEYRKRGAFEVYHDEIERDFLKRFFVNTWHIIFTRFDYIPDIMEDMKNTVFKLFPDYKKNPYIKNEKNGWALLKLLDSDNLQTEDLEKIKAAYLNKQSENSANTSAEDLSRLQLKAYRQLPKVKSAISHLHQNICEDKISDSDEIEKNTKQFADVIYAYGDIFSDSTSTLEVREQSRQIREKCREGNLPKNIELKLLAEMTENIEELEKIVKKRAAQCNVCKNEVFFSPFPYGIEKMRKKHGFLYGDTDFLLESRENWRCPICKAYDRDRLMVAFLEDVQPEKGEKLKMLQVAPAIALENYALNREDISYETLDLEMPGVTFQADLQDMHMIENETYDIVVCSHILEHVEDDAKAMSELFRILKPDGVCLALVPLNMEVRETDEEWGCSEEENWRRFGQGDHCRLYAREDFIHRLQKAGFYVNELGKNWFGEEFYQQHGFDDLSIMYVATKELRLV